MNLATITPSRAASTLLAIGLLGYLSPHAFDTAGLLNPPTLAAQDPQDPKITKALRDLRDIDEKRSQLRAKRQELAQKQLDLLRKAQPQSPSVAVLAATLDLHRAQDALRAALANAKVVATDGKYLGILAATYDLESVFCAYGRFGADWSTESIWCTFGDYGATYSTKSPTCNYSTTPPMIVIGGVEIASLSTGPFGMPITLSPSELRSIFVRD
jgi:hypothetical protein